MSGSSDRRRSGGSDGNSVASKTGSTRFEKGTSGNPAGRPKQRRPHVSAFDIIFDKTLTMTQGGRERELTVDEALQMQTYQAALKGSKMAIRKVLKMIEKREVALLKTAKPAANNMKVSHHYSSDNANEALRILGIADVEPCFESRIKVHT
ncbi:hypothetical protein G7A66_04350 [Altererythrobacter sp. SALINAS58]|uniref:DUF5681 domain-containing protein n=1 Tax=Alteripontixanthobacter muriae TaxID=2705546 RepID=UPI001576B4D0|nr:DUF5681 domain-containing protein [Alteripontixanthobacter muriae]NTZ42335.1 hypothetical protein [Alteripontixanthobacter muriae]